MDSAPPHMSEQVLRLLGHNQILVIMFPAYTINIVQALDLVFFATLEMIKQTVTGEFDEASNIRNLRKRDIFHLSSTFSLRRSTESYSRTQFIPICIIDIVLGNIIFRTLGWQLLHSAAATLNPLTCSQGDGFFLDVPCFFCSF
jgi:hypothetical protein